MRRNRSAEDALRKAAAAGGVFEDASILFAHGSGRGALRAFEADGWIEKVEPRGSHRQKYRITGKGRRALDGLKD